MTTKRIIFDANSTSPTSGVYCIGQGDCVQIRAWNLAALEEVTVEMVRLSDAALSQSEGSCAPVPKSQLSQILDVSPYAPCGYEQFLIDATRNAIVIRVPGCYRFQLTPAALGTAVVEAVFSEGEGCDQMASECCCQPEIPWLGTSTNACLTITPGGPAGHSPVFGLDACCLLQSLPANPNPVLTDRLVFLSGPDCFTATIDEVFSMAVVCDSLGEFGIGAYAAGDTLVALDAGENCKRLDIQAAVTATETPWTGTSNNVNLTITPGGVNGHAPIFDYDLCADIQATPICGCTPTTGDLVLIVQAGACVLATWPATDLCEQIGLLPLGAVLPDDRIPVREAGGACKYLPAATFLGGGVVFPLLAPDGTCLAPSYSFATDATTGMFYDPASPVLSGGGPAAVIGWDSCASRLDVGESIRLTAMNGDFIEVGASINITGDYASGSPIAILSGDRANVTIRTGPGNAQTSGDIIIEPGFINGGGVGGRTIIRSGEGVGFAGSNIQLEGGTGTSGGAIFIEGGFGQSGPGGGITINGGAVAAGFAGGGVSIVAAGSDTTPGTASLTGGVSSGLVEGGPGIVRGGTAFAPGGTPGYGLLQGGMAAVAGFGAEAVVQGGGGLGSIATSGDVVLASTDPTYVGAPRLFQVQRLRIHGPTGEWRLGGFPGLAGTAGQVITSQGLGLPPVWGSIGAAPILGADGSCAAPTYSFTSSPDSGMFYDPAGVGSVVIGDDTCADFISVGASIRAVTAIGDRVDIGASPSNGVAITAGSNGWVSINYDVGGAAQLTVPIAQIVRIFGAHSSTAATLGGEVRVTAGNSGAGSAAGAGVNITGGIVTGSTTALGANIQVGGGQPAVQGGALTLSGGNSTSALQPAGAALLRGGSGTSSNGGQVEVQSGVNVAAGIGGQLYLTLGGRAAATAMGDLHIRTRDAGSVYADLYTIIGNTGEFQIAGTAGVAGQAFTSNGPGLSPSWQTPAGVAEPITQIVYGTGPAVDSSPFFFWNVATGQLNLNINAGATPLSYAGGGGSDVTIRGSDRTAARGSDVYVLGGNGLGGFQDGGNITVEAGKTDAPGRFAGNLFLKGGSPLGGGTTATGGRVELQSGDGHGSTDAQAGNVNIFMGDPGSGVSNQTSAIQITRIDGQGGGLYIPGSNNSPVTLLGNDARYAAAPQGQNVTIQSGSGGTGTVVNAPSGNVILSINTPHGTGAVGVIKFEGARNPVSTAILPLGYVTAKGDWVLAGFGNGTNGGEHTPIPAAATTGFAWLPRVAAAPTGVPAGTEVPGGTGYAFPMCVEPSGATLVLWAYDFPNAAWRSVVLA